MNKDQEFSFGRVLIEMPIRYPSGDINKTSNVIAGAPEVVWAGLTYLAAINIDKLLKIIILDEITKTLIIPKEGKLSRRLLQC